MSRRAGTPARGGGRWVRVAPERIEGWIARFAARHTPAPRPGETPAAVRAEAREWGVLLAAPDGARAECHVPFPPFTPPPPEDTAADPVAALVAHVTRERRVGVLLVRLGGYAAGVFEGNELIESKVGARLVQGRTAAGGWSQQRFARRREKQAARAHGEAADVAARVLLPHLAGLSALVLGGDRRSVDALRADRRLAPLFALASGPFLTVPDPRLAVLRSTPEMFRAVRVRVIDPPMPS